MRKHFYTHLIDMEPLFSELDTLDLSDPERIDLSSLIDSYIHNTVLDTLLCDLGDDKEIFINLLGENDHDKIWIHLHEKIENVEEKLTQAINDLLKELQEDIAEAKRISARG